MRSNKQRGNQALVGAIPFFGLKINFDQPIEWKEFQKLMEITWLPVIL